MNTPANNKDIKEKFEIYKKKVPEKKPFTPTHIDLSQFKNIKDDMPYKGILVFHGVGCGMICDYDK